ncbi:Uncharacterized protein OBRU01_13422 [Operophtera brumata]|uniref:DUF155 domain-containing protein n=1 Tax=Operophtera brumata TaxID=104452 RepID=A0A0L7L8W9_OPEBR|nr:Uncharacterized protein OBRU01_13422 [Operophtera brumata]
MFLVKNNIYSLASTIGVRKYSSDSIQPSVALDNSGLPLKKKIIHKKSTPADLSQKEGHYLTFAFATANAYDLKSLKEALGQQKLYETGKLKSNEVGDVVVASAVYSVGSEPREIIFFREGAVVFWNCTEYEIESYPKEVVQKEKESARLGAWESRLEALAASVRYHTAAMEREGASHVDKKEVVRKLGELFSLRHRLTVESDLLDTPDFYWEEEQLERLYSATVAYFTIPRRTRVSVITGL